MSLPSILTGAKQGSVTIPENWLQGRTAYGGLSAAIALNAVKHEFANLPPLRSAQIAFVGPLAGPVSTKPTLLRRGKNSAFVSCAVTGADGVGLQALFLFMSSRTSAIDFLNLPAPQIFDPDEQLIDAAKLPQGFLTNFDLSEWVQSDGCVQRWCRLRDRDALDADIELVAIADALPPGAMTLLKQWGPISTTTWQLNLIIDTPETRDGWWLLEAKTLHAGHGSSSQTMTIWNRDGAPQATAMQSVALFI